MARTKQPIVQRALVTLGGTDDKQFPVQQVTYQGKVADVEVMFPYGMHANLLPGQTIGVLFALNNEEDNRAFMGYTPNLRPKELEVGEVVFYHPVTQSKILFRNNGDIDISSLTSVNITVAGSVNVTAANITAVAAVSISATAPNIDVTAAIKATVAAPIITATATTSATIAAPTITASGETISVVATGVATVTAPVVTVGATTSANITAPLINLTGVVSIEGALNVTGVSTALNHVSGTVSGNSHVHTIIQPNGTPSLGPT